MELMEEISNTYGEDAKIGLVGIALEVDYEEDGEEMNIVHAITSGAPVWVEEAFFRAAGKIIAD